MLNRLDKIYFWIVGHVFTASVFSFSVDVAKALVLGVAGGLGSLIVKLFYDKFIK